MQLKSIDQIRSETDTQLPRFREIAEHVDIVPITGPFLEALDEIGLDPTQQERNFLEPNTEVNPGYKFFWQKAAGLVKGFTPAKLVKAEAELKEVGFPYDNLHIFAQAQGFRRLVEAVTSDAWGENFRSGEDAFWEQVRVFSVQNGGPNRVPGNWKRILAQGGLPPADPATALWSSMRKSPLAKKVWSELHSQYEGGGRRNELAKDWSDEEARFYLYSPDGMSTIHNTYGIVEGYRSAMLHGTIEWAYREIPEEIRNQNEHWAKFLLTPYRVRCAQGFNALLKEAARQGVELLYANRIQP